MPKVPETDLCIFLIWPIRRANFLLARGRDFGTVAGQIYPLVHSWNSFDLDTDISFYQRIVHTVQTCDRSAVATSAPDFF